ncbi:hypothetical protein ABKN59_005656 [Abortiporus biennis]
MRQFSTFIFSLVLYALSIYAQTITTTDAQGNTIVEVVTLGAAGVPVTQVIQTITPTQATTTTPVIITSPTPDVQQGPVGQPPVTTGPAAPTVYQYTTTDANGETIAVVDTFTPTFPTTVPKTSFSTTGSVLDLSQYLSIVGTPTAPASSNAAVTLISNGLMSCAIAILTGMLGGAWLVAL